MASTILTRSLLRHVVRQDGALVRHSISQGVPRATAVSGVTRRLISTAPRLLRSQPFNHYRSATLLNSRATFSSTTTNKMPQELKASDINSENDPSVSKQYDTETSKEEQITDFYGIADKLKVGLLVAHRDNVGLVSRSMATAKREGPDFYFLCNKHSRKYKDISNNPEVQLSFEDSSTKSWISISGKATISTSDPKIKEIYSKPTAAWFGDLGDGVHDGSENDPRMTMIHVKSNYIVYYKTTVGVLGYVKEIAMATATGQVADTGLLREFSSADIERMRREA